MKCYCGGSLVGVQKKLTEIHNNVVVESEEFYVICDSSFCAYGDILKETAKFDGVNISFDNSIYLIFTNRDITSSGVSYISSIEIVTSLSDARKRFRVLGQHAHFIKYGINSFLKFMEWYAIESKRIMDRKELEFIRV